MAIYGYCRISTRKQNIDRQERNIKEAYPAAVIVKETYTGTSIDRREWNKLYSKVKGGDIIVFDSVSRMSRNAADGFTTYKALFEKGIDLVFLKEPHINTEVYKSTLSSLVSMTNTDVDLILQGVNAYLLKLAERQIELAFMQSEKEVLDLHQRTKEGIETARLAGKQIGAVKGKKLTTKKSIKAKEVIQKYNKDFGGSLADAETMKLAGVSRKTYYLYKKELKEDTAAEQLSFEETLADRKENE